MECDSVHRSIEANIKSQEIYLPSQYSALTKAARVHPKSYEAISLDYGFFTDFKARRPNSQVYKARKEIWRSKVPDVSVLIYKPDGTIWYKFNYDEAPKLLPQRLKVPKNTINSLPKLYDRRLSTSERKWQMLPRA